MGELASALRIAGWGFENRFGASAVSKARGVLIAVIGAKRARRSPEGDRVPFIPAEPSAARRRYGRARARRRG